ncbi:ankyrin-3-like [Momordica charantia]|uniref:Ankyrin-3-like n=1 Tax=Momordica charantia TaxID=3673 RepID=A0A6J1DZN8_MOMCH|nr:ankyrin-3-like [Momordica charantia]
MKLNDEGDTALHIAAAKKHVSFVHNLVQLISSSDLALKNDRGNTALTIASMSGVVKIAKLMVDKNPTLPNLLDPQNPQNPSPVFVAIAYKRRDMASFLLSKTNFYALHTSQQIELFIATISLDYYDIALKILKKKPELALERREENGDTALHVLARKPYGTIGSSSELRKTYLTDF